jgi:thioredoxin reductase (NADPH)
MQNHKVDVLIVGAGPAGLTAALYVGRAGKTAAVIEGRAPSRLSVGYTIENYPGVAAIDSRDLLAQIKDQALRFGAQVVKGDVIALSLDSDPKLVTTSEALIEAGAIILATGRPFSRSKIIPGEDRLVGAGVSYCAVCDGPLYRGREVAAYGPTAEAAEEVLALHDLGCRVHWVTGPVKDEDIPPERVEAIERLGVHVYPRAEIKEIIGTDRVEKVILKTESEEKTLVAAGVFIFREVPPGPLFSQAGLKLDHRQCLAVDRFQQTNLEGVFAAGDVTCGALQVVSAAGEGCIAALRAIAFLRAREE